MKIVISTNIVISEKCYVLSNDFASEGASASSNGASAETLLEASTCQ